MRPGQIALTVLSSLIVGTNVASAATYTYSNYTVAGEQTIQITNPNDIFGGMGQIDLVGTGSSAGVNIPAWCVDIYAYLLGNGYGGSGPFTYNITQPLTNATENVGFSSDGHNNSATLSTSQINEIGGLIAYGDANIGLPNVSAATQLAIWEVEYGSAFTFTGVSMATQNLASLEISELGPTIPLDSDVGLLTQGGRDANQTLVYTYPGGGGEQLTTPLPGSLPLFITAVGIFGIIGARRRKRSGTIAAV